MSAQKHRSLVKLVLLAMGAFFIFVTQTRAETTETTTATSTTTAVTRPAHPCKADVEKFCKDVPSGGGKINACMNEHENELSQSCKDKRVERKAKMAAAKKACEPDIQKFCKDVKPGQGAVQQCLQGHETELSQACRDAHWVKKKHVHGAKPTTTPTATAAPTE